MLKSFRYLSKPWNLLRLLNQIPKQSSNSTLPVPSVPVCCAKPSLIEAALLRTSIATPTGTRSASTTRELSTASSQEFRSE